ncbi:MAG: GAF domain-containing protein, partial [Longimicrobiales bacterium]
MIIHDTGERWAFLAEVSRTLASSMDYDVTLRNVAEMAVPEIADWCAVDVLVDGEIRRVAVFHKDPARLQFVQRLEELYPSDPDASTGVPNVLRTGRTESVSNIPDSLLVAAARDDRHLGLIRELGLRSYITAPLTTQAGRVVGAITLVHAESGRAYDDADVRFVEELARRAGTAIENSQLVRALTETRDQLQEQTVELEAQTAEMQEQAAELEEQAAELEMANERLGDVEARLRGVINSALDAIVTTDANSVITGWNARAEAIFGWSEGDAVGKSLTETIVPEPYRERHNRGVKHYLATGEGPILNRRIE